VTTAIGQHSWLNHASPEGTTRTAVSGKVGFRARAIARGTLLGFGVGNCRDSGRRAPLRHREAARTT